MTAGTDILTRRFRVSVQATEGRSTRVAIGSADTLQEAHVLIYENYVTDSGLFAIFDAEEQAYVYTERPSPEPTPFTPRGYYEDVEFPLDAGYRPYYYDGEKWYIVREGDSLNSFNALRISRMRRLS